MLKDYTYDGTFEGFLCCIYAHYYIDWAASIVSREDTGGKLLRIGNEGDSGINSVAAVQCSMFSSAYDVETSEEQAQKVQDAIENKMSNFDLRRIYRVFLSCAPNKEMMILKYVVRGFKSGKYFSLERSDADIYDMQVWDKRIGAEVHRLKGLVRFDELENGIMYSKITPDNNIVELLAHHFVDRFRSHPFIIHDISRNRAVVASDGRWFVAELKPEDIPALSPQSKKYAQLWRTYHQHIAIQQRKNSRCQRNFMPIRYWPNLTEMNES